MCLAGEVGSASMPACVRVCVCVGIYVCLKGGVHAVGLVQPGCQKNGLFPLRGPNEGFRRRAPTMRPGPGHKGHKNTPLVTQCKSLAGGVSALHPKVSDGA